MEGGEFQDWELLVSSDSEMGNLPKSVVQGPHNYDGIDADSGGMVRQNYFSLESDERFSSKAAADDVTEEEGSVESDNPSWIDPAPELRYQPRDAAGFWSDSGSDRSDDRKFSEYDARNELGFVNEKSKLEFGEIEGNSAKLESAEDQICSFGGKNEVAFEENMKIQTGIERFGETPSEKKESAEFWSDFSGDALVLSGVRKVNEVPGVLKASDGANGSEEDNSRAVEVSERNLSSDSEAQKKQVVWWKIPFEVFKYYVLRASPIWSISMAAALMGFVILGRRLYKMKRKTHTLHLKVTVDDKKVSQVMSRADRLNEAFSVVRRVPIVRPLLPAAGVNSWPKVSQVMSRADRLNEAFSVVRRVPIVRPLLPAAGVNSWPVMSLR